MARALLYASTLPMKSLDVDILPVSYPGGTIKQKLTWTTCRTQAPYEEHSQSAQSSPNCACQLCQIIPSESKVVLGIVDHGVVTEKIVPNYLQVKRDPVPSLLQVNGSLRI